jgi:hypothetical protein
MQTCVWALVTIYYQAAPISLTSNLQIAFINFELVLLID